MLMKCTKHHYRFEYYYTDESRHWTWDFRMSWQLVTICNYTKQLAQIAVTSQYNEQRALNANRLDMKYFLATCSFTVAYPSFVSPLPSSLSLFLFLSLSHSFHRHIHAMTFSTCDGYLIIYSYYFDFYRWVNKVTIILKWDITLVSLDFLFQNIHMTLQFLAWFHIF